MSGPLATAANESFAFIPAGDDELFGVFTEPTAPANGIAVLLCTGRSAVTSMGRSRMWTVLARRLAGSGFHVMRFDHRGLGESTGEERPWLLHKTFLDDAEAAIRWIRARGIDHVITMGTCGGARLALDAASAMPHVIGSVLFSMPVRDVLKGESSETLPMTEFVRRGLRWRTLRRLRQPAIRRSLLKRVRRKVARAWRDSRGRRDRVTEPKFHWVSPIVADAISNLVQRDVPVLLFFGEDDDYFADYRHGLDGPFGGVVAGGAGLITLDVVPDRFHRIPALDLQELMWDSIERWLPGVGLGRPQAEDVLSG